VLSVTNKPSVLSVNMLNVVMPSAVMPNVASPKIWKCEEKLKKTLPDDDPVDV
jgi:hypothetical protein